MYLTELWWLEMQEEVQNFLWVNINLTENKGFVHMK